ncbi:MAG: tRNA (adenosine(37)-N6)-dimethylallyltransferase MiaA [Bacteroidota bacterium]|nr:tRNA (adenosine(37)-N6)-dimethylallyltransferase MiaA [Bacteroidota bacterium]
MDNILIVVIGSTAIGKTALGIQLAKYFGSEIISSDSRQLFREMRIGTAVPSDEELALVKHHFIQNKSINDSYSVGDFEAESLALLKGLFQKNPIQIMVGGSGLYVDAVLKGFDHFPQIDSDIRRRVKQEYEDKGIAYLQNKLKELDPVYFKFISDNNPQTLHNPQRLMRFVEVSIGSGKPYSAFLNQETKSRDFRVILVGLQASRDVLHQRIEQRVDIMMEQGLVNEAQQLYPFREKNALQTVGYKELFSYFDGEISLEQAVHQIKQNTKKFAKRQLTWFKRYKDVIWFDYDTPTEEVVRRINKSI